MWIIKSFKKLKRHIFDKIESAYFNGSDEFGSFSLQNLRAKTLKMMVKLHLD